jgi:hypothetical protein
MPIGSPAMPTAERMAAGLAEDLDEEVGRAVDHLGLAGEVGVAPDHAEELHDLRHAVERAELVLDRA